jgi:ethanolamine utilization protein EutN
MGMKISDGFFPVGGNMIAGKVVGSLISTRKSEKLIGSKFMIVEPLRHMAADTRQIIAIDLVGAGIGEYVIVVQGSSARIGADMQDAPVDAAIVGIIDDGGVFESGAEEDT